VQVKKHSDVISKNNPLVSEGQNIKTPQFKPKTAFFYL